MADIQRYRPRRRSAPAGRWRRFVVWLIVVVIIFVLGKAVFGRRSSNDSENRTSANANNGISLLTDNANLAAANSTNADANTNAAVPAAPPGSWSGFSVKSCPQAISEFGTNKLVALTFDVAAANDQAKQVVSILRDQRASADFFVTGTMVAKDSNFIKSIADAGFSVYNHGQENKDLTKLEAADVTAQITKGEAAVSAVTNVSPQLMFRPPFGNVTAVTVKLINQAGYCAILWTVDAFDWKSDITADQAKQRVLDKLRPGAIVLLHAGYDVTPLFLKDLVTAITGQGYQLVSLSQLLNG